jgi:hypothetical protein
MSESTDGKLEFHLRNTNGSAKPDETQRLFNEAFEAALKEAGGPDDFQAKAQAEGGLFGIGETAIFLLIVHALKVGGIAFGEGALTAAGKSFYERFLEPQLVKRNLLPSKLEEQVTGSKPAVTDQK